MPDQDRLDAISEALVKIIRRQDELEARLRKLEGAEAPVAVEVHPPPLPLPRLPIPVPVQSAAEAPRSFEPEAIPRVSDELPKQGLETQVGLNWINRIAVVTLILGSAFFFKYAVDNDWIGPGARVALGVVAAMISLFAGDRMWHRGHKVFAQGLTGFGLALLYLSFYAAFGLYHLLPQAVVFLLMVLTTTSSGVFALRYESQAIALLGLLAGYGTPIMLSAGEDHPWILFSYVFVLNLAALALARMKKWHAIEYGAFLATTILFAGWYISIFQTRSRTVATTFAIAFWAQFSTTESTVIWMFSQLAGSLGAAVIWSQPPNFLILDLLFAAGGLAVAHIRRWIISPPWTLFCFWLGYVVCMVDGNTEGYREYSVGLLSVGFLLFFLWVPWWAAVQKRVVRSADLLVLAANGAAYFGASYYLLNDAYHAYMGLFAAALAGIHLIAAKLLWNPELHEERDKWPALLAISVTLTFLTLAVPIQFAGFRITIAWALEGAALAWLAARFNSDKIRVFAWIILVLTVARLFAYDSWVYLGAPPLTAFANLRFFTFLVCAVSLWLTAWFTRTGLEAGVPYIAGHFVMLWGLGLEVLLWVQQSVAQANLWSAQTIAISILMAIYGLALISIGVMYRSALNRILGLGLMGLVVAKLYLSDIWQLGLVFRIVAFLGLGALLLAVSYLYSRFRPMIEKLWKDDPAV